MPKSKSPNWSVNSGQIRAVTTIRLVAIGVVLFCTLSASADESSVGRIVEACKKGNEQLVAMEIFRDPKVIEEANQARQPLLAMAVKANGNNCVAYLLSKGAASYLMEEGNTPLELATRKGDDRSIEMLLDRASILDLPSFAHFGRVKLALENFATEPNVWRLEQALARFRNSSPDANAEWRVLASSMEAAGSKPETRFFNCLSFLAKMSKAPFPPEIWTRLGPILSRHLSADQMQELVLTAIGSGNESILLALREAGFKPSGDLRQKAEAVFERAVGNWQPNIASPLIRSGVLSKDSLNAAAQSAASSQNIDLLTILLDNGIDKDLSDEKGVTLLMYGLMNGRAAVIEMLVSRGCNLKSRDSAGRTVADYVDKYWLEEALPEILKREKAIGPRGE